MADIYVSTLAFGVKDIKEIIRVAEAENLALEFSSGVPYNIDMERIYIEAPVKKIPHNYFPAPEYPFVLNLASSDTRIRTQSIQHCIKGLQLSLLAGAPFFSAHAGFCIDPNSSELGRKINYNPAFDKAEHVQIFLESLKIILDEAEQLDMQFLMENNVIISINLVDGLKNPLLCCESNEISLIMNKINNDRFGVLLDTAHLKVSCQTLCIDKDAEVKNLESYIKAIHHSDNNGIEDSNEPLNDNYWFLHHLEKFNSLPQVIEVKNIDISTIKRQLKLLQAYGC